MQGLAEKGFGGDQLAEMQKIIDAEKSDLFDVLAYVAYALPKLTREERATNAKVAISTFHTNSLLSLNTRWHETPKTRSTYHSHPTQAITFTSEVSYDMRINPSKGSRGGQPKHTNPQPHLEAESPIPKNPPRPKSFALQSCAGW